MMTYSKEVLVKKHTSSKGVCQSLVNILMNIRNLKMSTTCDQGEDPLSLYVYTLLSVLSFFFLFSLIQQRTIYVIGRKPILWARSKLKFTLLLPFSSVEEKKLMVKRRS